MSGKKTRERFLKKFTEELINVKRNEINSRTKVNQEKARVRKEVEVYKMKKKYLKPKKSKPLAQTPLKKSTMPVSQPTIRPKPIPILKVQPQPASLNVPSTLLDLGKINPLVKDPAITSIECQGPGKQVIVKKNNQIMKTDIKLNKEEIDHIISEFSEKARIPLMEGMLRARVDNLQISAVVSKVASSRFIITKQATYELPTMVKQPTQLQRPPMPPTGRPIMPKSQPMPPIRRPFTPGALQRGPQPRPAPGRPMPSRPGLGIPPRTIPPRK